MSILEPLMQALGHMIDARVALILVAAAGVALIANAIGGDRQDAALRGTYDAGVAQEVTQTGRQA